jgi:two-component system sensor histidine kinase UhpB
VSNIARFGTYLLHHRRLSLFEKVILANSLMLLGEAIAGLWVTSHNLEAHHYLIDTSFIVLATLLSLLVNIFLLRTSFRPLFSLIATIRAVSAGKTDARASAHPADSEIGELAQAFNSMLDRLESAHRERAMLILQTQERERRRIALELHDESSQNLTALLVHTEILSQSLQSLPETQISPKAREQLLERLHHLTQLTQKTLEDIHLLAQQLRPSILDDLGLQAALRSLAEDSRQRLHISIELHISDVEQAIRTSSYSALLETTLFRIAQECLTNVARHAHAHLVTLSLAQEARQIRLRISDDGCGYDVYRQHAGLGIAGIRERVALLGGKIMISSHQDQGTTVEAIFPIPCNTPEGSSQ